jgi:hypothetical protein
VGYKLGRRRSPLRAAPCSRDSLPILAENRLRVVYAWCGSAMVVLDPEGSTSAVENTGFYFRQTRYLRDLRLELFDEAP